MYESNYEHLMVSGSAVPFVLPHWIACAPFEEYLEMTILEAREGKALLTMPFKVKHAQGGGLMHGGAVTALADTAVAMAIKSLLPEGTHFVTIELNLKFHAPVTGGEVRAEARTEWRDERTIEGIAEVFSGDTKAATFTSVFRVKRPKQG
jgi:acyl-CoA thioesterase